MDPVRPVFYRRQIPYRRKMNKRLLVSLIGLLAVTCRTPANKSESAETDSKEVDDPAAPAAVRASFTDSADLRVAQYLAAELDGNYLSDDVYIYGCEEDNQPASDVIEATLTANVIKRELSRD